jgi:hypothetical protein
MHPSEDAPNESSTLLVWNPMITDLGEPQSTDVVILGILE